MLLNVFNFDKTDKNQEYNMPFICDSIKIYAF